MDRRVGSAAKPSLMARGVSPDEGVVHETHVEQHSRAAELGDHGDAESQPRDEVGLF